MVLATGLVTGAVFDEGDTVLLSNERIALSPDVAAICGLVGSVAAETIAGFACENESGRFDAKVCVAGVAGVTEITGVGADVVDLAGVCKAVIVCDVLGNVFVLVKFVAFTVVGVLEMRVVFDFDAADNGLVAIVFESSCNCSGLVTPENKSIEVRTRRSIFLKLSESTDGELDC